MSLNISTNEATQMNISSEISLSFDISTSEATQGGDDCLGILLPNESFSEFSYSGL